MTTSAQTSPRSFGHALPHAAPLARPRPDLPSWFAGATTTLYAVSAGLALVLAGLTLVAATGWVPVAIVDVASPFVGVLTTGLTLGTGAWCFTLAHSRRVDPTTPQLSPAWFLAAWFLPIVNILVPHRMFGDLWASAKWQQSDRRGSNSPLAPRPWIITAWACTSGLLLAMVVLALFRDGGTMSLAISLGLSAMVAGLLGGIVHAIARETGI